MATVERLLQNGTRRGDRALRVLGDELRDKRLAVGLSQREVAWGCDISRSTYTRIEGGRCATLSIRRASQVAAVLGLDLSFATYPGGNPLRDTAQAERLSRLLVYVVAPLTYRTEVGLPQRDGQPIEQTSLGRHDLRARTKDRCRDGDADQGRSGVGAAHRPEAARRSSGQPRSSWLLTRGTTERCFGKIQPCFPGWPD